MVSLEEFIKSPTLDALSNITHDELLRVAGHYKVEVHGSPVKADLFNLLAEALSAQGIFTDGENTLPDPQRGSPVSDGSTRPIITKATLELRRLELREKEIEWEREKTRLEADRQAVRERERWEHELKLKDLEITQAIRLKELDIKARKSVFIFQVVNLM